MTGKIVWDRAKLELRIEMRSAGRIEAQRLALLNYLVLEGKVDCSMRFTKADAKLLRWMDEGRMPCEAQIVITPKPGVSEDLLRKICCDDRIVLDTPRQLALPMPASLP